MESNKKSSSSNKNAMMRYARAPIRALIKLRDLYVTRMTALSGTVIGYDGAMGCPGTVPLCALPKSFSVTSRREEEDVRELMRAASQRGLREKKEMEGKPKASMPRSNTVALGRIDEDKTFDFGDSKKMEVESVMYPRSRSCFVGKKSNVLS